MATGVTLDVAQLVAHFVADDAPKYLVEAARFIVFDVLPPEVSGNVSWFVDLVCLWRTWNKGYFEDVLGVAIVIVEVMFDSISRILLHRVLSSVYGTLLWTRRRHILARKFIVHFGLRLQKLTGADFDIRRNFVIERGLASVEDNEARFWPVFHSEHFFYCKVWMQFELRNVRTWNFCSLMRIAPIDLVLVWREIHCEIFTGVFTSPSSSKRLCHFNLRVFGDRCRWVQ